MKQFLSILRNLAHVASGALLINPDPRYQLAGGALALLATGGSQVAAKRTKPKTGGIKPAQTPDARLLAVGLVALLTFGCATVPQPDSIERKAFAVTRLIATKVLEKNPYVKEDFIAARDALEMLSLNETVGVEQLLEILDALPVELIEGDTQLYVETAVLFFADDIGAVGVSNPTEVRRAAAGMIRAFDTVLN